MRSFKLVPLVAAAAALLALAPTGASARRASSVHPHAVRPCHVRLEAPKGPIANGDPATLVGALKCPPSTSPGGRLVTLYEQSAPKASFAQVATAMTEPSGAFQVTPPVFMTNSVFYAVVEGAQSARKAIRVTAAITALPPTPVEGAQLFTGGGRNLRRHNRVTFAGEVSPLDKGAIVALQRESATGDRRMAQDRPGNGRRIGQILDRAHVRLARRREPSRGRASAQDQRSSGDLAGLI